MGRGPPRSSQLLRKGALRKRSSQQPLRGREQLCQGPSVRGSSPVASRTPLRPLQHLRLQVVFSILRLHVLCISDSLDWMHGHTGTEKSHSTVYLIPLLAIKKHHFLLTARLPSPTPPMTSTSSPALTSHPTKLDPLIICQKGNCLKKKKKKPKQMGTLPLEMSKHLTVDT